MANVYKCVLVQWLRYNSDLIVWRNNMTGWLAPHCLSALPSP